MSRQPNYFLQTIEHLRHYEEVLLFANLFRINGEEQREAVAYLAKEYREESLGYPCTAPPFDEAAARWAAQTFYTAAQLLLFRQNKEADLPLLLPAYEGAMTAGAVLSADLMLRFLPDIILQLKAIDPDDGLIAVLETHLKTWHYSGVRYPLPAAGLDFSFLTASPPWQQLYADRVIQYKRGDLANHPALAQSVAASLGHYAPQLWSDFKPEPLKHETR